MTDRQVVQHIEKLIHEEQGLYSMSTLTKTERGRLRSLEVLLDQYWDLLRQRRALHEAGKNPKSAKLRSAKVVEHYEQ